MKHQDILIATIVVVVISLFYLKSLYITVGLVLMLLMLLGENHTQQTKPLSVVDSECIQSDSLKSSLEIVDKSVEKQEQFGEEKNHLENGLLPGNVEVNPVISRETQLMPDTPVESLEVSSKTAETVELPIPSGSLDIKKKELK